MVKDDLVDLVHNQLLATLGCKATDQVLLTESMTETSNKSLLSKLNQANRNKEAALNSNPTLNGRDRAPVEKLRKKPVVTKCMKQLQEMANEITALKGERSEVEAPAKKARPLYTHSILDERASS